MNRNFGLLYIDDKNTNYVFKKNDSILIEILNYRYYYFKKA